MPDYEDSPSIKAAVAKQAELDAVNGNASPEPDPEEEKQPDPPEG